MNERKAFKTEKEAVNYAREIENLIKTKGAQPEISKEKLAMADAYLSILDKLKPHGKTPEDAADHYIKHLGNEFLQKSKPPIRDLVDQWQAFKFSDTTLGKKMIIEIGLYSRFIKAKFANAKPDEPKRNEIDVLLRGLKVANNTRRKYLKFIRMFFSWVFDEGIIARNPTDGISYKADDFDGRFYDVPTTKKILKFVAENEKDLIGYYALLTFAGLRPTEGARVQWLDFSFKTNELYVRKGKTNARHIILEPVAVEWINYHRKNTPHDAPFVGQTALPNREKEIRKQTMNGGWIQDGLRHGFATYYKSTIKNISSVADYMGNAADVVKRHYARTIPADECRDFWNLTPSIVLAADPGTSTPTPPTSDVPEK